jgi:hypothetical protein
MKERGILFSGEMVRAILDGRKTQTRRTVRRQPDGTERWERQIAAATCIDAEPGTHFWRPLYRGGVGAGIVCPYGQPGDRLWVRETWSPWADHMTRDYCIDQRDPNAHLPAVYAANHPGCSSLDAGGDKRWHPSIHMPRALARLVLDVTEVRVERLQGISDADARAEGIGADPAHGEIPPSFEHAPREMFRHLWDSINGERAPWTANPWVWVVTFKRIEVARAE